MALVVATVMFILPVFAVRDEPLIKLPERESEESSASRQESEATEASTAEVTSVQADAVRETEGSADSEVIVRVSMPDGVKEMTLAEYLPGVVAAEMPSDFPQEALRAQAVAARTFTYRRMLDSLEGKGAHEDADVCTDSSHCKAYTAEAVGEEARTAVSDTDGLVVLYSEEPILAVFHSTSSGQTENSEDVWGSEVPYLRSVDSPGEEESPNYTGEVRMTQEEFKEKFLEVFAEADFSGVAEVWAKNIVRSDSGGVITMQIGGVEISGSTVRSIYGLLSANFTLTVDGNDMVFKTYGYGHGVGMSQYGARARALEGLSFEEILEWYYTGTSVGKYNLNNK